MAILLATAFMNFFVYVPPSKAGTVNEFSDGSSELIITFPGTGSKYIKVPSDANVTKATINFTTLANDDGIYPENIELKFGEVLPIDWAYQGTWHGAYGYQEYFKDSQVRVNLTYDGDQYNDTLSFLLPKDAEVSQASMKMTAFEYDYWEPGIQEINIPDGQTWNQDPFPFVFQNRLWIFYRDYNSTQTSESDGDLTVQSTTDGTNWGQPSEISMSPDTPAGYPGTGPTHIAGDFHPFAVEFDGDMGVFWGSMSFYNLPQPNPWSGLTNGSDRDIVTRWYDPSTGWGNWVEITHPTENANESHYTKNPDDDEGNTIHPWHKTDQRPNAAVFNNKVYAVWMTNNTGNTTFWMHDDDFDPDLDDNYEPWWHWNHKGDIIISSSSDGIHWSKGFDLTAPDRWWDVDFAPSLCVFDDKLFAMWETNAPHYINYTTGEKRVDVTTKYDWDIVYRYTSDGENWSDFIEMTPKNDTPKGTTGAANAIPDEDPRLMVYTDPVTNEERMYCIWRTRNPKITNGTDYDIVVSYTTDGITWTAPEEMTDKKKNGGYDNKPELTVFDNKLYVVWRREQGERWVDNPDGDIVTRHWDGKEWSVLQEVSPFDGDGTGRDDFYPNSIGFNNGVQNKLYTFWVTRNRGKGWTEGSDGDVVVRSMIPSNLPIRAGLDIGSDSTWEVPKATQFTDAVQVKNVDILTAVQGLLEDPTYVSNNLVKDDFGNEFVEFKMNVYIEEPGRIRFDDLRIWYNTTMSVGDGETYSSEVKSNPFAEKINRYVRENQDKADAEGMVTVKLDVTSPSEGRIKMHDLFLEYNRVPTFKVLKPLDTSLVLENKTTQVKITWEDFDIDDNAEIAFYYHTGKYQSYNKDNLIIDGIKEDDETDSYIWTLTDADIKSETYYSIFGVITDGVNIISSYAPGNLYIKWVTPPPPFIIITEPNGKQDVSWEEFRIEWDDSGVDGATDGGAKITLYYSPVFISNISGNVNATQIDLDGDGDITELDFIWENDDGKKGQFLWDIRHLSVGSSYYISAIIDDGINPPVFDCSKYKMARTYIPEPNNFMVQGGTEIGTDQYETHNTRPQLTWNMLPGNYLFFITVWEGTNNQGIKLFEANNITELNIDIDPESGKLEYGKSYYAEVYAMNYQGAFSAITSMNFKVVNNPPSLPTVIIVPEIPNSANPLEVLEPSEKVDVDGDHITYSYKWFKDDVHQPEFDDIRTIPAEKTSKNEMWSVEVTPHDGIGIGTSQEIAVMIRNTLPTVTIENPTGGGEYFNDLEINIHATAIDLDDDSLSIEWYFDLPDPDNITVVTTGSEIPDRTGGIEALKFEKKFSKGRHNLTLFVRDGDVGKDGSLGTLAWVTFKVKGPFTPPDEESSIWEEMGIAILAIIIIVIIVLVLLAVMFIMRKRRPKSEREKLYGEDMGLKPGEAYLAEETTGDDYFGDDLDRKGPSSLGGAAPQQDQVPATEQPKAMPEQQKPPELPPAQAAPKSPTTPEKPAEKK
jgi:hypothetical protein